MKKTLLATTAFVAMSGAAYAQVSLSGSAEIGFQDGDGIPQIQLHGDMDIKFTLSGASDNGLTFGATIDTDEFTKTGAFSNRSGPHSVFVSGAFGTLTVGDTDGAYDKAMIEIASGSALTDDMSSYAGYSGNAGFDGVHDGQIMRYDYSFGDFSVAVSLELDDTQTSVYDDAIAIGGKWSGSFGGTDLSIGVGYQDVGAGGDIVGISGRAGFGGGFSVNAQYQDGSVIPVVGLIADFSQWGVAGAYETGPWLFGVSYSAAEINNAASPNGEADGWGFVVNYDLGGGAVVELGYGDGECNIDAATLTGCTIGSSSGNGNGDQTWSFGLGLSF